MNVRECSSDEEHLDSELSYSLVVSFICTVRSAKETCSSWVVQGNYNTCINSRMGT